jgi:hypothetical protein
MIIRFNIAIPILSNYLVNRNPIILGLVNNSRLIILKVDPIHIDVRETLRFLNWQISHVISYYFFTQFSYFTRIIFLALYLHMNL